MNRRYFSVVSGFLLLSSGLCMSGCGIPWDARHNAPNAINPGGPGADSALNLPIKIVQSDIEKKVDAIQKNAYGLLLRKQYAQIEKQAAQMRRSRAILPDGRWELTYFYRGLAFLPDSASDAEWVTWRDNIQSWVKHSPQSITARVALIRVLQDGAHRARGGGWASEVQNDQWQVVRERVALAEQAIKDSYAMRTQCPGWFAAAQGLALLTDWDRQQYDQFADEGIRLFPAYHDLHFTRVLYLLPRWNGDEGEWQQYVNRVADQIGGRAGDVFYARVFWSLQSVGSLGKFHEDPQLSWARVDKGYKTLMQRYPKSFGVVSSYTLEAVYFGKRAEVKTLMQRRIRNRAALDIWTTKDYFIKCLTWSMRTPNA